MFGNLFNHLGSLELRSPLGPLGWAVLTAVPLGIIALYFLKLRRKPVQVSSTLLWRKSLEDLHVNSLFQRLRRNLLLFLQLLAVLLAMLALAGLQSQGGAGSVQRYVLMIDHSASMSATDVSPSRLQAAKEKAQQVVTAMKGDDLAMVISFADSARVVSNYTGDKRLLRERINSIQPSQARTSLREALQVAAGLANPSRQIGEGVVATEAAITPLLYIYTDGGFPDVEGFSLGNLKPEIVVIGPPPPAYASPAQGVADAADKPKARNPSDNLAILTLQARANEERPELQQLFGRVHNFRQTPVTTDLQLIRHDPNQPGGEGELIDALSLEVPAQSDQAFKFDINDTDLAELEVRIPEKDALDVDNRAFAVVGNTRKAQVLVATDGDRFLENSFKTPTITATAEVLVVGAVELKSENLKRDLREGRFDLVVLDGVSPEVSPEANTLYFGAFPPGELYAKPKAVEQPVILDWNISHPMMQYIRDLSLVFIAKANLVEPPPGAIPLMESNLGTLAFAIPREGFTDAVVMFPLLDGRTPNTTWFRYISFPLFLLNAIQALGNVRQEGGEELRSPSQPVILRADSQGKPINVISADGRESTQLTRTAQGTFVYNQAETTGFYHARWEPSGLLPFSVNLFDQRESDLAPRGLVPDGVPDDQAEAYRIKIGYNAVEGTGEGIRQQQSWWKWFACAALAVLLIEWYIYNKRVYL